MLAQADIEALKAVFELCSPDARGGAFKQTALAFHTCPDELTRWLVSQGADLNAGDQYGETPLHARAGHWQGDVSLLIELGADVNHHAGGRGTPLHRAAAVGNLRTARALLEHGANADATNAAGQTPLLFALQRCSNATLERMAPMAELLLKAMTAPEVRPSMLGRLLGAKAKRASPVSQAMQEQVTRLGGNFEFHRAGFNPDSVKAASDALDRLYSLFDVPPVPRRAMHDGTSAITAKAATWQDRHRELWELLVPSSGAAATIQGEVIRISGRISDELKRNGGANWDGDYRKMADAILAHLSSGNALSTADMKAAAQTVAEIKLQRGDPAELCRLAVEWVARNPKPQTLPTPAYTR
ncbi:ankyrin repeat domain-containing protein [Novosphingobium terrae]|uniref:ankyrin repeat domain-containing protein n=1 Tax=Novosphingobium terrae TaxID=2726189 RepID=UPI001F143163|nr:ankyrin repeat domain-containing protein [Novosphingobium terrae]